MTFLTFFFQSLTNKIQAFFIIGLVLIISNSTKAVNFVTDLNCFSSVSFSDAPNSWQFGLQDPATPIMEGIIDFHNHLMFFMILVVTLVCWLLFQCINLFQNNTQISKFSHAPLLEIIWTLFPALILMIISVPSFALLYAIDASTDPRVTLKIIGHQWYWSYEYSDYNSIRSNNILKFDSYMINEEDLSIGAFRLLEVDNRIVLPIKEHIRLIVTASDVIHSWAIPSFGVKLDAVPGRLNQIYIYIKRSGVFYGQCSEICGINHGFMPIVVKAIPFKSYINWVLTSFSNK